MNSVIQWKLRSREINIPADYVDICRTARMNPSPYKEVYLDYTYFRSFDGLKFYNSRPGALSEDPVVTNIRCLKYNPSGKNKNNLMLLQYNDE